MNPETKNLYAFSLGREEELCLAELKAVFLRESISYSLHRVSKSIAYINIANLEDYGEKRLMSLLAGTIKIFKIFAEKKDRNFYDLVRDEIKKMSSEGKFSFGFSDYTGEKIHTDKLGFALKKELKRDMSIRYVRSKGKAMSSAQSLHNSFLDKGAEFGFFKYEDNYLLGKLVALNDPEEWSKRDFEKPRSDAKSGMVPPKLGRMMVNLALGQGISNDKYQIPKKISNSELKKFKNIKEFDICNSDFDIHNNVVLDPFCGSGNILLEAVMLGCDIIGSDISEKAVEDTRENLGWLCQQITNDKLQMTNEKLKNLGQLPVRRCQTLAGGGQLEISNNLEDVIFQADATAPQLVEKLKELTGEPTQISIVSEPYLGEPKKQQRSLSETKDEYKEVETLYVDFFANLKKLKKAEADIQSLCIIFPLVETKQGRYSLYKEIVDKIRDLGYSIPREPFLYGRDYQTVKREVVLFTL